MSTHDVGLAYLPTELYNSIVAHLEADCSDYYEFQSSLLALSRVLYRSPLPIEGLFREINITTPRKAQRLWLKLFKQPAFASYVKVFRYETFEADAEIVVNLLAVLQDITELSLYFGPTFAPSHVEELFAKPRTILTKLSLRFRPYVQKATYYQFLKGAYFDSLLDHLSSWPRCSLPQFSLVQDALHPSIAPTKQFAQPLVFFRLDPIASLAASPYASSLASIRLRIPSRTIVPHLHRYEQSFPSLRLLDVGTSKLSERDLEAMLVDLPQVHTLILDGCPIVSQRADALDVRGAEVPEALNQWTELGKMLAMTGVKRARTREKNIKSWLEQQKKVAAGSRAQHPGSTEKEKKAGRRGIANATISLRGAKDDPVDHGGLKPTAPLPPSATPATPGKGMGKGKGKGKAQLTHTTRKKTSGADVKSSTAETRRAASEPLKPTSFRLLPAPPNIRSLSLTTPMASVTSPNFKDKYNLIHQAFAQGWAHGVRIMGETRTRVRTSWWNGVVRVHVTDSKPDKSVRDEGHDTSDEDDSASEVPTSDSPSSSEFESDNAAAGAHGRTYNAHLKRLFANMHLATVPEDFELDLATVECPVLCLAGPTKNDFHPSGCPHEAAWRVWDDGVAQHALHITESSGSISVR